MHTTLKIGRSRVLEMNTDGVDEAFLELTAAS
jgi:hypothetical protein